MKIYRVLFLLICLLITVSWVLSRTNTISFAKTIFFLTGAKEIGDFGDQFSAEMSHSGSFVAGVSNGIDESGNRMLYLWDISSIDQNDIVELNKPTIYPFLGAWSISLDFSPDSRFLALQTKNEIQILSIPSLEIYQTLLVLDNAIAESISWSSNGELLATFETGAFVVWDVKNEETYHYPLDTYGRIIPIEDGWIIGASDLNSKIAFTFCTLLLERCDSYSTTYGLENLVASSNGNAVFTTPYSMEGEGHTRQWKRLDDKFIPAPISTENFVSPKGFSPTGKYVAANGVLWDAESLQALQKLGEIDRIVWLPDERHFLISRGTLELFIYRLGQLEPIDVLNIETLPIDLDEYILMEAAKPQNVSEDGQKLFMNLGSAALVISLKNNEN